MSEAMKFSPSPRADHHAAGVADAGRNDLIRFARRHDHHAVRAFDPCAGSSGAAASRSIPLSKILFDQVHDRFRIRIRIETNPFCEQLFLQLEEVFDNAVVDNHHLAGLPMCGCALRAEGSPWVAQRV